MELYVLNAGKTTVVLLDDDMKIVKPVYDFLKFQQQKSKANNTLLANGRDLCLYWTFLSKNGYSYDQITPRMIAEFIDFLRSGGDVLALYKESARSNRTINRILSTVHTFYQYQSDMQEIDNPIGDLLKLRTDCIQPHFISGYTITWFDHKKRMERTPIPVRAECAYAVQKLIEITEPLRKEVDDSMKDMLFIYRISTSRLGKKIGIPNQSTIGDWLHNFTKKHHIVDSNGEPYNLTAHQFRRTLGTDMLSKGTDMNVIQQVLGHSRSSTTKLYYADVKDKERGEIFRKVGIIGNIDMVDDSSFENTSEKEWFLANKHKSAQLCDGYCTKPVEKGMVCDRLLRRQKCYSCSRYITTPEYLHVHRSHLSRLEKQLEEGAIYGEHYAEHFRPTIEILKVIIEKLEEFQNGRD